MPDPSSRVIVTDLSLLVGTPVCPPCVPEARVALVLSLDAPTLFGMRPSLPATFSLHQAD